MTASGVRLALKLTLVLTAWTLIVLSGYGYYRMKHALAWVEGDLRRDELLVGSVLRPAAEHAYAHGGIEAAEHIMLGLISLVGVAATAVALARARSMAVRA